MPGDGFALSVYRIEWRAHLTTRWLYMDGAENHDEAMEKMAAIYRQHKGQVRLVTQHVIEAHGFGLESDYMKRKAGDGPK